MTRLYTLDLVCPDCNRTEQIKVSNTKVNARLNCGHCLIESVKVVEMKVVRVTCEGEEGSK